MENDTIKTASGKKEFINNEADKIFFIKSSKAELNKGRNPINILKQLSNFLRKLI
jgi:hypothetical protein